MPFDALTLSVLTSELSTTLEKGRITKIMQPEKDEITLLIYSGQNHKLVVSASSSLPRMHLTSDNKENPLTAPSFCMLLRKHLTNGQIVKVWQQPFERVIILDIISSDELSDKTLKRLICELTGKSANVFLTDGNYKILGSLKSSPLSSLTDRPTLAGQTYQFLKQDKIEPGDTAAILSLLQTAKPQNPKEFLKDKIKGVSPVTLEEIINNQTDQHKIANSFSSFLKKLENYTVFASEERARQSSYPCLVLSADGSPVDALPMYFQTITLPKQPYTTLNETFDIYFSQKDSTKRHGEKTRQISQTIKSAQARIEKKVALQKQDLLNAQESETNRIYGDLIISNLYKLKKGDSFLVAENFYEPAQSTVKIPIDEALTAQQNAQRYYKKYAKQKKTIEHTQILLAENEKQLSYIKSIALSLSAPLDSADIAEILLELDALRLTRKQVSNSQSKSHSSKPNSPMSLRFARSAGAQRGNPAKIKLPASKPLTYQVQNYTILVGKNNAQNDRLTFSTAKADDLWLHTKAIHSAHTIILNPSGSEITDEVLTIAAEITAHYSEAKNSTKVPVDYALRKHVKKPSGSPLGFVTYTNHKTILVNPNSHSSGLKEK